MAFRNLTQGSIPRLIVVLALPVLGSFFLQSLYTLADLFFVGLLGGAPLGGLGIAANSFFLVLALGRTVGVGAMALLSQAYGKKDLAAVRDVYGQAFLLVLLLGGGAWVLAYSYADAYFSLLTADADVHREGVTYFKIYAATFLLQQFVMVNGFCWRALGDFITPTLLMTGGALLNMVLDPILIFGWGPIPAMGIAGAAWATIGSQAVAAAVFVGLIFFNRRNELLRVGRNLRVELPVVGRMLRIGLPSGIDFALLGGVTIITYRFILPFGGEATAAVGVGIRLVHIAFFPPVAVCAAVASLVGQNFGARHLPRVRRTLAWGGAIAFFTMALEYAFFAINPAFWVGLFSEQPAIVAMGAQYLVTIGMVLPLTGISLAFAFGLQGMGRTLFPLAAMSGRLVFFLTALLTLEALSRITVTTIFVATAASHVVEASLMFLVMFYLWRYLLADDPPPKEPQPAAEGAQA